MMFGNATSPEDFWNQSTFSFKFFSITSVVVLIISLFITPLSIIFMDIPSLTIFSFQIWRLFFSFYAQLPNAMSIISLLFSFLWMRPMLKVKYFITKDDESSIYKIIEVVLINLEIHLVLNIMVLILGMFIETNYIFGFGWFPVILVYEFRNSTINPEAVRNLCCLPFLIKAKYFPWVLLAILGLFSNQFFCFVACGIVGYFQEVIWREMFLKLPFGFYSKLESCLPKSITNRSDYISISQSESSLKSKCLSSFGSLFSRNENHFQNERDNNNPFSEQAIENHQISSNAGKGQAIGGANYNDFKNYWSNKQQNSNQQPQSFEIQNNNTQQSTTSDNDSYAAFQDGRSQDQNSEQNLQVQKKKKHENENENSESYI